MGSEHPQAADVDPPVGEHVQHLRVPGGRPYCANAVSCDVDGHPKFVGAKDEQGREPCLDVELPTLDLDEVGDDLCPEMAFDGVGLLQPVGNLVVGEAGKLSISRSHDPSFVGADHCTMRV